ncbi:MAG: hypothetical protein LBJ76_01760, partial [Candidatus Accumulibacter sp.]|nr:hypothetical protein [Accumulibacter sp.]
LSAQSALLRGNAEIARLTLGAGQVRSSQRARLAASGIDLDVGNAREIQASTEMLKNADVGTLKANAIKSAFGYKAQGLNYQSEALMKGLSASTVNSNTAMTGSLLSGASQVASSWYAMNKAGVFASSGSGASLWG